MRFVASRAWGLVLVLCTLAMSLAFSPSVEASQQHKCVADLAIKKNDVAAAAHGTTAIAVHGYGESARSWKGDASIEKILQSIENVNPTYFDYEQVNTRWVTDPQIAPRLAQNIACFSILSKRPVILLAHSMGGLAAREALDSAAYGIRIKDVVGHVITIGTPHKGSRFADADSQFWLASCEGPFNLLLADACKQINAARATGGMQVGSEQLAKLAHFPPGISVKAIAGEASWHVCVPWGCSPSVSTGGDLVVPVDSATAEYTNMGQGDGKKVFTCDTDNLVSPWSSAWCEHNNMLKAPQVQTEVKNSIDQYLRRVKLDEGGGQFTGLWEVHGSQVTFNEDGTGEESSSYGFCYEDYSCRAKVKFNWEPVEGGLSYTVISVSVVALADNGNVPVTDVDTSDLEQPGKVVNVKLVAPGLLERSPHGEGNPYLCRQAEMNPDDRYKCGA